MESELFLLGHSHVLTVDLLPVDYDTSLIELNKAGTLLSWACPLACAIKRTTGQKVRLGATALIVGEGDSCKNYALSRETMLALWAFDQGRKPYPPNFRAVFVEYGYEHLVATG